MADDKRKRVTVDPVSGGNLYVTRKLYRDKFDGPRDNRVVVGKYLPPKDHVWIMIHFWSRFRDYRRHTFAPRSMKPKEYLEIARRFRQRIKMQEGI